MIDEQFHKCEKCGYVWFGRLHPCIICEKDEFDIWFNNNNNKIY